MKSLTLHLSVILLLLGSLHNANNLISSLASAAAATLITSATVPTLTADGVTTTTTTTTTTLQPPSLPKPHQQPTTTTATTRAMTTSTTTPTTRVGRRKPAARNAAAAQDNQHIATATLDDAAAFSSTLLVRNANATTGNVRQNRSFQSGSTSPLAQRNDNNAADKNNNNNKLQKIQRRLPAHRTNQHGSITTTPATTTTTTSSTAATDKSTLRTSASSKQQSPSSFLANHHHHHRQSKQQQLQPQQQQQQQELNDPPKQQQQHQQQRTTKTPRMIHRLVAGHIQNAEGHSTYQVSSVTTNSSFSNTATTPATNIKSTAIYFRRKPQLSSSYRQSKLSSAVIASSTTNTTVAPLRPRAVQDSIEDRDDDEALLDDPDDFDNWDHGILRLSAGAGKENSAKSKKKLEDSKKTLSDQVRDGKYGLIEKELFRRQPKRPGVLSYLPNKEVPIDNEHNYGGLNEEDIWLAEDHLLVIKGGSLNDDESNEPWPPIDDYDAPGRQIKLPPNPKVPPPFPVQLEENGPLQFIGNNKFTIVYPVTNESLPVYPTGPENNYASSESDDEKNLLARPGSPQDPTEDEPGYIYPAPSPPWLYHNQTFVNPFLSKARPITFPGLGPFPFGRNSSLDNSDNGTDFFDEDDPALYYPPAYSFVYKSNYSNPVPPGPLVPGIVLPPPPNQFSRLEKTTKLKATTISAPTRQRVYTTTTSTTTTTTTTTSTTTSAPTTTKTTTTAETPYRQSLTKIHEYKPKTITITSAPPAGIVSSINTPHRIPLTKTLPPKPIEPVPVPVAVPVPIYPASHFGKAPPSRVSYPTTTAEPPVETFSKSNPIYYEYFEPKREPTTANYIDDFDVTTSRPALAARPIKLYPTSKRPFKLLQNNRNSVQIVPPQRPYVQENVVYITPRPDIRPYGTYKAPPVFKPRPLENFEHEVDEIRQTLRYYQNQQLRDNNIPRTPKAKPVYEYSYDANPNIAPVQPETRSFQPPDEFDEEPFQPMVTYSPPVDDENAFRAIAYDKVDNEESSVAQQQRQQQQRPKYQTTTTLIPVQPSPQYQGRTKKIRLGAAKYLAPLANGGYQKQQQQQRYQLEYQSTPRSIPATQPPWVSLDKQELSEYQQSEDEQQISPQQQQQQPQPQPRYQPERYEVQTDAIAPRHRVFPGYYYGPPPPPGRKNNRFYDEPFQNPVRKIVNNYRPPPVPPQQQQQQQQPVWSLENDTYVNYAPNRPPLNPDAEFIDPYQNIPINPYGNQGQRFAQQQPQALSHQSQYYGPPQRFPLRQAQQHQQQQHQQQPQYQPTPLHRDVLVNYRQPLPPLNPDSEFISHPHVVRPQIYRSNSYRTAPSAGEQSNVYYITPKYRRGSNGNSNGNSNNNNNNNNANYNSGNRH